MRKSLWGLLFFLFLGGLLPLADAGDGLRTSKLNLSGHWEVIEEVDTDNCGEGVFTIEFGIEIDQKHDVLTVKTPDATLKGYIKNGVATWSGQYSENGGTFRIYGEVVFEEDGYFFEGSETWNWENGSELCVGTGRLSGSRRCNFSDENSENLQHSDNFSDSMGCFIGDILTGLNFRKRR